MKNSNITILPLIILLIFGCTPKEEDKPNEILKSALENAGGEENWNNLKSIRFEKRTQLFLEDGSIEMDRKELQEIQFNPLKISIFWMNDGDSHLIKYENGMCQKLVNGEPVESPCEQTAMSTLFIMGLPFKIKDPGTIISNEGTYSFKDSIEVDVVSASYDPAQNENQSTADKWWFYFEKETGKFIASKIFHHPTYALVQNLEFTDPIPVRFPIYRKTYRIDSLNNIQYLRAIFDYANYQVETY